MFRFVLILWQLCYHINSVIGLELPPLRTQPLAEPVDYDTYSFAQTESSELMWYHKRGIYESTKRQYSAFVSLFSPPFFSFYPPTTNGCTDLVMPSTSSQTFNCEYSTNGAFFTWDTSQPSLCLGNLISDGYRWQIPTDGTGTYRVNFGTTSDETIIGFLDDNTINQTSFQTLITGCGWLVRNGKSYVALSPDLSPNSTFTTEKAPRTSVGQFSNGTMILVEVDGCEDLEDGPDLYELADLLTSLGVDSAINLDGGGSSVSVYNGEVIDKPTCNDSPDVCERADASITCVKRSIDRF